jgi:hypothetical protein
MKDDRLGALIREGLREEAKDVTMSSSLKNRIIKNTIENPQTFYQRFVKVMNTTIDIPLPSALAACLLILSISFSSFWVTNEMKRDKSIQGYTSIKVIKIGPCDVYIYNTGNRGDAR